MRGDRPHPPPRSCRSNQVTQLRSCLLSALATGREHCRWCPATISWAVLDARHGVERPAAAVVCMPAPVRGRSDVFSPLSESTTVEAAGDCLQSAMSRWVSALDNLARVGEQPGCGRGRDDASWPGTMRGDRPHLPPRSCRQNQVTRPRSCMRTAPADGRTAPPLESSKNQLGGTRCASRRRASSGGGRTMLAPARGRSDLFSPLSQSTTVQYAGACLCRQCRAGCLIWTISRASGSNQAGAGGETGRVRRVWSAPILCTALEFFRSRL